MNLDVRCAGPDDIDVVIDVLAEASAWLRAKGILQWPKRFPKELIFTTLERGELYVGTSDTEIIATVTLQWSDPSFWGDRKDAGFVHRLAVRRSHVGAGHVLIEWAEKQAADRGLAYLCLDCLSSNTRLRQYYEDLGFHAVREIAGPVDHPHGAAHGPWKATLYERAIGKR